MKAETSHAVQSAPAIVVGARMHTSDITRRTSATTRRKRGHD